MPAPVFERSNCVRVVRQQRRDRRVERPCRRRRSPRRARSRRRSARGDATGAPAQRALDRRVVGHQLALASRRRRSARRRSRPARRRSPRPRRTRAWTTSSPSRKTWPAVSRRCASAVRRRRVRPRRDAAGAEPAPAAARSAWSVSSRGISSMKRERRPNARAPNDVAAARVGEREVAHRAGDADVGEPALLLEAPSSIARECGNTPSSMPMMNTIGNSRPLALWSVISVTRPSSSRSASASASSAICCRNSSSEPSLGASRRTRAPTRTSSSRFSIRPCASIVRSASSASR